jgi:phosphoribosylanthranilate isomerase
MTITRPLYYRPRVKICGITSPNDARLAAHAGADAIGLVFYPPSPRSVDLEHAQQIASALPAFVSTVALLVDAEDDLIDSICTHLHPGLLQFHGHESAIDCARFAYPYIKAIRMKIDTDVIQIMQEHQNPWCKGLLLDAYHPSKAGGTGETFDWNVIPTPEKRTLPLILAGGLNPLNVKEAIQNVQPWAVDVSSGVEYAPGQKCPDSMRAFIQGALDAVVPLPR